MPFNPRCVANFAYDKFLSLLYCSSFIASMSILKIINFKIKKFFFCSGVVIVALIAILIMEVKKMKLLTKKQREKLVDAYQKNMMLSNANERHLEIKKEKDKAIVKLFNPTGAGTWYLTELNPRTNVAFGLAGIHEWELGYIDLNELAAFKGQFGLGVERDRWFKPKTIEQIQEEITGLTKERRAEVKENILKEVQQ